MGCRACENYSRHFGGAVGISRILLRKYIRTYYKFSLTSNSIFVKLKIIEYYKLLSLIDSIAEIEQSIR